MSFTVTTITVGFLMKGYSCIITYIVTSAYVDEDHKSKYVGLNNLPINCSVTSPKIACSLINLERISSHQAALEEAACCYIHQHQQYRMLRITVFLVAKVIKAVKYLFAPLWGETKKIITLFEKCMLYMYSKISGYILQINLKILNGSFKFYKRFNRQL